MRAGFPRRTGVLVIRAWLENGEPAVLRARITWTLDVSRHETNAASAGRPDEIEDVVRSWLAAVLAGDDTVTGR
jgi:hypothetical protein